MQNHSYENEFHLHVDYHANQTHFHLNRFALGLVLKMRQRTTRKWPISGPNETAKFVLPFSPTDPVPRMSTTDESNLPLWMVIVIVFGTVVGLGLILFSGVHLFYLLASKSQDGGVIQAQRHSEEVELFTSEHV